MSRTNQLDLALAALNDGALPSSEEDFINLFCNAYLHHEANGLKDPKIKGREADDDDGTRVRVRTKFRGTKLELPSRYIRDQTPPAERHKGNSAGVGCRARCRGGQWIARG